MNLILKISFWSYKGFISPLWHQVVLWPGGCRFSPTCSIYGLGAIRQYGLFFGFVLFLKRLLRCHPWGCGGYDPVPSSTNRESNSEYTNSYIRKGFVIR